MRYRSIGMGHLSANPTGPNPSAEELVRREPESKGHRWLWILALAVLVGVGFWYFRGPHASTEAQGPGAPGGASQGQGRQGAGGMGVPAVVPTAQRGGLPVYFNGFRPATAFNNVTVQ